MTSFKRYYLTVLISLFTCAPVFADSVPSPAPKADDISIIADFGRHHGSGSTDWEDIVVPLGFFLMIVTLLWLRGRARIKIAQARMDTIKLLAEKGLAIPAELLRDESGRELDPGYRSPMSRGIAQVGVGVAFILYFLATDRHSAFWAIGVALVIMGGGKIWLANQNKPKG